MYTGWPPLPLFGGPAGVTSVGALGSFQSTGTLMAAATAKTAKMAVNCIFDWLMKMDASMKIRFEGRSSALI